MRLTVLVVGLIKEYCLLWCGAVLGSSVFGLFVGCWSSLLWCFCDFEVRYLILLEALRVGIYLKLWLQIVVCLDVLVLLY